MDWFMQQIQSHMISCSTTNMENRTSKMLQTMVVVFLVSLVSIFSVSVARNDDRKLKILPVDNEETGLQTYIVLVQKPEGKISTSSVDDSWYYSFLPSTVLSSEEGQQRMVHTYRHILSGFAAKLTAEEARTMEEKDGVLSVQPQKILHLHTTRSPKFLGLVENSGFWKDSNLGKGVIVGVLDTGIAPDHPSFSDKGVPPPPAKWKGKCEFNGTLCNNKLIGARNFVSTNSKSTLTAVPFDDDGHGTHTASTAAGNFVEGVSALGNAAGTAVGMAPMAHLAMYKVCSETGCPETGILAAMDAAVDDGVDVLSLSLGGDSTPFYSDGIAIGAFAAMQKGIFMSCSAGNSGPSERSLSNEAPWILTVGASTLDRSIVALTEMGNSKFLFGESLFQPANYTPQLLPVVYPGPNKSFCGPQSLSGIDVKGKIVVCDRGGQIARIAKGQEVKDAGGAGMILVNDQPSGFSTLADAHVLPASNVGFASGETIKAYINSTSSPTARISFRGTAIGDVVFGRTAPIIASFSSRGPNVQSPGVLKPDIIGPGVNILAAWPYSLDNKTNSKAAFNVISGTSMSCPHLSGIAALLKSAHPDWSPAAIRSAIMTSANLLNLQGKPIQDETLNAANILATGSGQVNPPRATEPGLIYDIQPDDYIPYLCGLGYNDRQMEVIVQQQVSCSKVGSIPDTQLNYPSFSVVFGNDSQTYTRRVTYVGTNVTTYTVSVFPPPGVNITVSPTQLTFTKPKQTEIYTVTFTKTRGTVDEEALSQGFLSWGAPNVNDVRSPILAIFNPKA